LRELLALIKQQALSWFPEFLEAYNRSDKKTYKDNLQPFFATTDTCADYVNVENYAKFEDRAPDKWNEIIKNIFDEGKVKPHVIQKPEDT
jgi:hypothetical protein